MPTQLEDTAVIPIEWLRELIFRDPPSHVWASDYKSKIASLDFTPVKVRIEIGRLLSGLDPESNRFVVFLYPDTPHAEVWPRKEWDESISKRLAAVTLSASQRVEYFTTSAKHNAIRAWLNTNMGIKPDSEASARLTIAFARLKVIPSELKQFTGLTELLEQHGNLNA